jgi:hypothetical protein
VSSAPSLASEDEDNEDEDVREEGRKEERENACEGAA